MNITTGTPTELPSGCLFDGSHSSATDFSRRIVELADHYGFIEGMGERSAERDDADDAEFWYELSESAVAYLQDHLDGGDERWFYVHESSLFLDADAED